MSLTLENIARSIVTHGKNDVGAGDLANANGNGLGGGRHRFRIAGTYVYRRATLYRRDKHAQGGKNIIDNELYKQSFYRSS